MDLAVFSAARAGSTKSKGFTPAEINTHLGVLLSIAGNLGYVHKPGHKVLDFGCGIGDTVAVLLDMGMDAYGVDVGEWWGKDHSAYWHDSPIPPERVRKRLSYTSEANYRLPYPGGCFDLVISDQVFEHVFNYVDVFRELKRVTKPGGISVHVFPGPWTPREPHLGIPVTGLCKYEWWLRLWSVLMRQDFKTWREKMKSNNYPSRATLERFAKEAGVIPTFHAPLYVEAAKGRPWRMLNSRIGWLLRPLVLKLCQRCLSLG
jgi:ubiquinone/menaquinone biosynthesis C-methylase UbiE